MEVSVCQVARGASDLTIDGVIQYVENCRARLNDDLRSCTQELCTQELMRVGQLQQPAHRGQPVT